MVYIAVLHILSSRFFFASSLWILLRPLLRILSVLCAVAGSSVSLPAIADINGNAEVFATKAPLVEHSLLLDIARAGDALVAVGERGHILRSTDNAVSWQQAEQVPTQATLTGVFFQDETRGWAVGHDTTILLTRDGGVNWEQVYSAPQDETPLLDVMFVNDKQGIAVGAYGLFMISNDGGVSWSKRDFITKSVNQPVYDRLDGPRDAAEPVTVEDMIDFHLNHITQADASTLYIAAEAGNIYRSDDLGRSWQQLNSPYEGSFFGVLPLNAEQLLIFGLRGHLFRSDDKGASWQPVETATQAMLTDALQTSEGVVVIAGLGGVSLMSFNQGQNFVVKPRADRLGNVALVEAKDGSIVMVGEGGVRRLVANDLAVPAKP